MEIIIEIVLDISMNQEIDDACNQYILPQKLQRIGSGATGHCIAESNGVVDVEDDCGDHIFVVGVVHGMEHMTLNPCTEDTKYIVYVIPENWNITGLWNAFPDSRAGHEWP